MSIHNEFVEYIVDQLSAVGVVQTSKMFGGVLLKVQNKQLGVVIGDMLYFKVVEPELQEKYLDMGSEQFSYIRKDKDEPVVIKNWWSVPEEVVEDSTKLTALAYEVLLQGGNGILV